MKPIIKETQAQNVSKALTKVEEVQLKLEDQYPTLEEYFPEIKVEMVSEPYFFSNIQVLSTYPRFFSSSSGQLPSFFRDNLEEEYLPSTNPRFRQSYGTTTYKAPEEFLNMDDSFQNCLPRESSTREQSPIWNRYENKRLDFENGLAFFIDTKYE